MPHLIVSITQKEALQMMNAVVDKAVSDGGAPVAVAVVDHAGRLVAFTAMDYVMPASIKLSQSKAYSAVIGQRDTIKWAAMKKNTEQVDFDMYNWTVSTNHISAEWSYAAFVFTSFIITLGFVMAGKIQFNVSPKTFSLGAAAGMVNGLGVLASFAAYRAEGKAAAVTTIAGSLQPVFTIILAVLFLSEKLSGYEVLGIVLAIAGALMLSYEKKNKAKPFTIIKT